MRAVILVLSLLAAGLRAETPRELIGQGAREHAAGREEQALALFERALATATNDTQAAAAASYNLGAMLYRKGDGEAAATRFKEALRTPDPSLQRDAFHNQGNLQMKAAAALEAGDKLEDAIKEVAAALVSYDGAMLLDPSAEDTRANIELALEYEKALKVKLEQQKKEQEKKDQEKKDQEKKEQEKKEQEKQDQEKKDQEKKDQENKDQQNPENKDQQQQEQEKKDQEKKDQEKKDQEKKDQQKQEQESEKESKDFTRQEEQRKPGELTEEEARRLLEAQREEEKALRANFRIQHGRPERVQKDY